MTNLVLERMERHQKGEKLHDLFMPWMEDKSGHKPDISTRDRIAGKSNCPTSAAQIAVCYQTCCTRRNPFIHIQKGNTRRVKLGSHSAKKSLRHTSAHGVALVDTSSDP